MAVGSPFVLYVRFSKVIISNTSSVDGNTKWSQMVSLYTYLINAYGIKFGRRMTAEETAGILATKTRLMVKDLWFYAKTNKRFIADMVDQKMPLDDANDIATLVRYIMQRAELQETQEFFNTFTFPDVDNDNTTQTKVCTQLPNDEADWADLASETFLDCFETTVE